MRDKKQGFTLVELAVSLVVIAFIIGGIIVGKSIIRNAQLQSVLADVDRFQKTVYLFRDKYKYLPGDMPTADTFWGLDSSCPNTTSNTTPKTATCPGDGNGRIGGYDCGSGTCSWSNQYETYRAWQQLADANFIPGTYTGVAGSVGANDVLPGINSPKPSIPGGGYVMTWYNDPNGVNGFSVASMHTVMFGKATTTSGVWSPILTASEALIMDLKIDDGLPGTGNVQGPSGTSCTTGTSPANYNGSVSGNICMLRFYFP